jgi:hypothetical protein
LKKIVGTKLDPEFELTDTGIFDDDRYFDVVAEYAKYVPDDILIRITVANRGPESATLHLLPTLWFRNTWTWKCVHEGTSIKPQIRQEKGNLLVASHETLGNFFLAIGVSPGGGEPRVLFTENETNTRRLWNFGAADGFVKDAFHEYIISDNAASVNGVGTKAAPYYLLSIPARASQTVKLRLFAEKEAPALPLDDRFEQIFETRIREADEFYSSIGLAKLNDDERNVVRQAYAGLTLVKAVLQLHRAGLVERRSGNGTAGESPAGSQYRVATYL